MVIEATKRKFDLQLQHSVHLSHYEFWKVVGETVHVLSITPLNYPTREKIIFETKAEAYKNFLMLTRKKEGWYVVKRKRTWNDYAHLAEQEFEATRPRDASGVIKRMAGEVPDDNSDMPDNDIPSCQSCGCEDIVYMDYNEEEQMNYLKCNECGDEFDETLM